MVLRVAFFILMAMALVGFGTVAWVALRQPPAPAPVAQTAPVAAPTAAPAPAPVAQKKILVASRGIGVGIMLKPEDLIAKQVPEAEFPAAILADTPDVVRSLAGAMTKHAIGAGEPIGNEDVMKPSDHGFMAAALRPGMRAVTIGVDATSGSAGLVWPGDRVDLILTLTDQARTPGRRVSAETILKDARVIAIDQQMIQGGAADAQARTVTLEVLPDAVQRVSVAMRLGRLSISVRALSTDGTADTAGGTSNSVYASDVSSAFGGEAPAVPTDRTVRVYHGSADPKEFKY